MSTPLSPALASEGVSLLRSCASALYASPMAAQHFSEPVLDFVEALPVDGGADFFISAVLAPVVRGLAQADDKKRAGDLIGFASSFRVGGAAPLKSTHRAALKELRAELKSHTPAK